MEEIVKDFREKEKNQTVNLQGNWKELAIKRLTFSYHGNEGGDLHLNNVSLTIRKNEKIALVGESGSGKTTFLKLIRNLFNPRSVDLYLDNKEVTGKFAAISENIAFIPQEPEIFSTTMRENITVGLEHADEYIKKFTEMACFTPIVERLPKKLDSSIFEKGVNLSGGEKQRLALARGLMAAADKPVVFLDEPTSSVDAKNEMQIYDNIFRAFKNKTIISTVHRLHLLHRFNKILVFDKGKIVATGTLQDLLNNSQEFKTLWKKYHRAQKEMD
jgi:ABC-type multidrug transport system fused ATPase/permease subunit